MNICIGGGEYRPEVATAILERKIHPDINLLAQELESSSHAHEGEKNEAEAKQEHSREPSDLEKVGFVGLKPSARSHRFHEEGRHKNNRLKSRRSGASISNREHESPFRYLPTKQDSVCREHTAPKFDMRWSTLLKRPGTPMVVERISQGSVIGSTTKSASQSSLEKSQSFDMSHRRSNSYGRTGQLLRTPDSETNSGQQYTPSYSAGSPGKTNVLSSPHIFGPSCSDNSEQDESFFDFKEIPPPLPPLNHPAFRERPPSSFKYSTAKYNFPALSSSQASSIHTQESPAGRQTARSLPSLKLSKGKRGSKSGKNSHQSLRSTLTVRTEPQSDTKQHHHLHSPRQSENSITTFASSRRSSAEYSAKQASSITEGIHEMRGGCWEVEVSKAMLSLALGREDQPGVVEATPRRQHTSSFGSRQARGKNRSRGGTLELGSPFLLQDTRRDNLKDSQLTRNYFGCTLTSTEPPNPIAVVGQDISRNTVMSNGESILRTSSTHINSTRKGKERASPDTHSLPGSRSRKTGRALSNPSSSLRLATPPEHARLDAASVFGTLQGSSTLKPPQVAIIQATPDTSPITPTAKRGHHKSTPTMPTASVLKTANAPVIEKSYSNGSSKRKADEAGVNGDKTPPKEAREARTTFAPEPRPHRASATSGVSTHAPSSFNRSKRVRLSESSEGRGSHRPASRASILPTPNDSPPNAKNTGSWSSKGSHVPMSRSSHSYGPPPAPSASHASYQSNAQSHHRTPSRRSLSQASIPISALISPHAPSIGRLSTFHMRDPRKPNPIQNTPWSLSFPSPAEQDDSRWSWRSWVERGGSPLHAWLFFIGFIFFPLWWAAALFIPIPRTRTLGEPVDTEKGVMLDDPQLEHDAKSWRTRCRVMAGVSLLTYVPFIILVAIFA